MAPKLVIATHNAHKVDEIWAILAAALPGLTRDDVADASFFNAAAPVEDGVTFAENALIKARELARLTGIPALADDSGIAVDVLGGAPGVFSARWAGSHGDDAANLRLLLDQLGDVPAPHRAASFVCVAALVTPDGREFTETGMMSGALATAPAGGGGFGYDPIFVPTGYDLTTAEITAEQKNAISHRGQAFRAIAPTVSSVIS